MVQQMWKKKLLSKVNSKIIFKYGNFTQDKVYKTYQGFWSPSVTDETYPYHYDDDDESWYGDGNNGGDLYVWFHSSGGLGKHACKKIKCITAYRKSQYLYVLTLTVGVWNFLFLCPKH
jgi:hypothetical protein